MFLDPESNLIILIVTKRYRYSTLYSEILGSLKFVTILLWRYFETNNDGDVYFTNDIDNESFITYSDGTETSYSNICIERKRDLRKYL